MKQIDTIKLTQPKKTNRYFGRSSRMKAVISFLGGVTLALMVSLLFQTTVMAQSVSLSDSSGAPGTSITVSGSGFTDGDTYSIRFAPGTTYDSLLITGGTVTGTSFSQPINIPAVPWGQYIIRVVTSRGTFSPTFTVVPLTDISRTSGAVGDIIVLSGVGFRADVRVNALFDNTEVANTQTNSFGSFSGMSFTVPAAYRGNHTVRVTDGIASTNHGFSVVPKLTISPQSGVVDDRIDLNGSGFTANSPITIFWDNDAISTGAIIADSNGSFASTDFVVPGSTEGAHTIRARDGGYASATASVEVIGRGFESNRSIDLTFSGISVATTPDNIVTNSSGTFTARFTVPGVAAGSYTIRATDGINDTSAAFSIEARLNLSPASGHVGSEVTVSGNGFTPEGRVAITYDTEQVVTVTTSNAGTFSVSFTVPASKGGPHSVTARDLSNQTISAVGTFTMETVAPSVPLLVQPEYDTQASVTPLFKWTAVTDPSGVTYQLQVARDSTFSRIVLSKPDLTEPSYQVSQGEKLDLTKKDNPYYWRVRAVDKADNSSQWTSPASFYTEDSTPPGTPTLLRPQYGANSNGETFFDWSDVSDPSGVTYQLQVAGDIDFSSLLIDKQGISLSEYTVTQAEKLPRTSGDSPYYWRVRAIDGAGNAGDWSSPGAFYVGFLLRGWVLYLIMGIGGLVILLFGILIGVRFIARKTESVSDSTT
jgi:hypothetical protein